MNISEKFFKSPFTVLFIITNMTIYVEVILVRLIKEGGKWKVFLKNVIGLLLILLIFSIFFRFIELLFNLNMIFIHYTFLLFFSLMMIFFFKRINKGYILRIISCLMFLVYYKIRDNHFEKLLLNFIWMLVLLLLWYYFVYFIVTKIYLNFSLTVDSTIIHVISIPVYLVTVYIIFVYFPESKMDRKRRKKLVNIVLTILINIVVSMLTYNDVLSLNDKEMISLKILSWFFGISLLIFSIIDYISLVIINYRMPFFILRKYVRYKEDANCMLDLTTAQLKNICIDFRQSPQLYKSLIADIEWFIYSKKINFQMLFLKVFCILICAQIFFNRLIKMDFSLMNNKLNIDLLKSDLSIKIVISIFLIIVICLLINYGIIYIKQQCTNINFKKFIKIIETFSLLLLFIMYTLYILFNQYFEVSIVNKVVAYTTIFLMLIFLLSSVCIFLIDKYFI